MELILGSASPRRKEILSLFTIPFRQIASDFDEDSIAKKDPIKYVETLALEKGKVIANTFPDACILTADTDVSIDGRILGKPQSHQECVEFLQTLSGRWNSIFTAVAVTCKGKQKVLVEETRILMNSLSMLDIERYIGSRHLFDKSGYTIQNNGYILVNKMEGCYYNAMGLPINPMRALLLECGIDLWDYLK